MKAACSEVSECTIVKASLVDCTQRIGGGGGGPEETCEEEIFDFLHCVDHCVAKSLFDKLK